MGQGGIAGILESSLSPVLVVIVILSARPRSYRWFDGGAKAGEGYSAEEIVNGMARAATSEVDVLVFGNWS